MGMFIPNWLELEKTSHQELDGEQVMEGKN
jgi:hypothetical protein